MIRKLSLLIAIVCINLAAIADVIPVKSGKPLVLQPDPLPGLSGQTVIPGATDNWNNIRINSDNSGQVQNEEQIICNPTNPNNLVAVWRDFRLGYRRIGVGYSMDGGSTWHDELMVEPSYPWQSDPGLTYHTSGAIYAVILSYTSTSNTNGLFVSRSLNGGVSWGPFYPAVNGVTGAFEDKELIACDRSGSQYDGNLYVTWARFTSVSRIYSVRSTDGGVSWSTAVPVSDNTSVQWPVPAVGPHGEVYVAWVRYSPSSIRIDRSFNGGTTWGTDLTVQSTGFAQAEINPQLSIFAFPAMDVDITNGPNRGKIYIAYTDDPHGDTDIYFTSSADSGSHWLTPIRVNDDTIANGADQFHPWLVCDENGALHLIFYDRRLDLPQNLMMDLFYTHSENGGLTWAPNQRISDVSSNPANDSLRSGLIGEYNGLAVRNGVVHPIWTDTRFLNQDAFTAVWSETPNLDITITPVNPPIVIPANGGGFRYNIIVHNLTTQQQTFTVWNKVRSQSGAYIQVFGPVTRTLPGNANPTRLLTQNIAASIPAGTNTYLSYIGTYPNTIQDSSFFTFTKSTVADGNPWVGKSNCEGDFFDEYASQDSPPIIPNSSFVIHNCAPNPFNLTTTISYELQAADFMNLSVYDISGKKVAELVNGMREAGVQTVTFDGSGLSSGVYIYRLQTSGSGPKGMASQTTPTTVSGKIVLLK
ncbi:MAG: T9SS type A sorting domain-containing protein [bacterium]|nr:T9SS type A sorting domain-containing protein [bacterium]